MAQLDKEKYLVLMVDDSEDDCLLIRAAVEQMGRLHLIGSVANGEEVIAYLKGTGQYADRAVHPVPDLLLLDLKMPGKDGFQVLEWLQTQPFPDMIVVVLSGCEHSTDLKRALDLGADYCHPKEGSSAKRLDLVKRLEAYVTGKG